MAVPMQIAAQAQTGKGDVEVLSTDATVASGLEVRARE
jgi:hypothetical protein